MPSKRLRRAPPRLPDPPPRRAPMEARRRKISPPQSRGSRQPAQPSQTTKRLRRSKAFPTLWSRPWARPRRMRSTPQRASSSRRPRRSARRMPPRRPTLSRIIPTSSGLSTIRPTRSPSRSPQVSATSSTPASPAACFPGLPLPTAARSPGRS